MTCPRAWELRALDEGRLGAREVAAFERHRRGCATCRDAWLAAERLREATSHLPEVAPSELELRRVRTRVLRDAMTPPRPNRGRAFVALASTAVLAAAFTWGAQARLLQSRTPSTPPFGAVVTAPSGARWSQEREGPVERVRVTEGDLRLHVRKQLPGERFLVELPDGEVEVRGTTFEVTVREGKTTRVHVDEGVVSVRVHGVFTLSAGETWNAPSDAPSPRVATEPASRDEAAVTATRGSSPVAAAPAPEARPSHSRAGHEAVADAAVSRPADAAADAEFVEYERAIDAYRLGRFEQSASLMRAFQVRHPLSALIDDASFVEASSVASAGDARRAALLAEAHRRRFPDSFHALDAAILVARGKRDEGDCVAARAALAGWLVDPKARSEIDAALGSCAEMPPPAR